MIKASISYFLLANIEQLLVSVHQLVESAPLGEFSERLNILDAFSEDMYIKGKKCSWRDEMCMAVCVVCSTYVFLLVAGKFKLV